MQSCLLLGFNKTKADSAASYAYVEGDVTREIAFYILGGRGYRRYADTPRLLALLRIRSLVVRYCIRAPQTFRETPSYSP